MPKDDGDPTDAELVEKLAEKGFQGPAYETFADRLVGYGIDVLHGQCCTGEIFQLAAEKTRRRIFPTGDELHLLATSDVDREELVLETVAEAERLFRRRALVEGGWTPGGGASLTTYFFGACLLCLPNAFRRWRRRRGQEVPTEREVLLALADRHHSYDPADDVLDRQTLAKELATMRPVIRETLVRMKLYGESLAVVAESFDMTPKALEGLLYRWKKSRSSAGEELA